MQLQHLLSATRRAVQDYHMIEPGDKIAIGISGGKDSLILALALSHLRRFYPKPFTIIGITVSLGFEPFDLSEVERFLTSLDIPFYICSTQIGEIVFEKRQESNPCALCSKMRKGALYRKAQELGCHKVALGHNRDDINETLLMSLFLGGCFHTMPPISTMDQVNLKVIRPLIYCSEKDIRQFAIERKFPIVKNPCPVDGKTQRETMKQLIKSLQKDIPKLPENLFGSVQKSTLEGWALREETKYE